MQVVDLLFELVDAFGRIGVAGEDRLLDRLDVVLDLLDYRLVVIDDRVEDPPDHRRRAALEQRRTLLQPLPRAGQVAGIAMAHGDRVAGAEEHVDLTELHPLPARLVARGAQHDEVEVVVALDLGALVRARRVLDRQLVQAEARMQLVHHLRAGLVQLQPDETAAPTRTGGGAFDRHRAVILTDPSHVVRAVNKHGAPPRTNGQPIAHTVSPRPPAVGRGPRFAASRTIGPPPPVAYG
jgi:hypothetical protein